jgi:hypothetical protein
MADENEKADAKAKDDEIAKLQEEKRKAEDRVANAEKKFNEWSNEVGGIRKVGGELKETLDAAKAQFSEISSIISQMKSNAPSGKMMENSAGKKEETETPEDIEKVLTQEQRGVVEAAWKALTDDEKEQYDKDPEFRASLFKRAQEDAPAVPRSPWKTAPKKEKTEDASNYKSILDRIFEKKRQARFVPPGPQSGVSGFGIAGQFANKNEPQEDSRVH